MTDLPPYDPAFIGQHTDYRAFIADALVVMGRSQTDLATWLAMSRSNLCQILASTKKLNPTTMARLVEFFGLDPDGALALAALVDLDNDSLRARRSAAVAVKARVFFRDTPRVTDDELFALKASPYASVVHSLAFCRGFRWDPAWIAAHLVPPIAESEAAEALEVQRRLGGIRPRADGTWEPVDRTYLTEEVVKGRARAMAVARSHEGAYRLAAGALDRFGPDERSSSAAVFPVDAARVPMLFAHLREMVREVVLTAQHDPGAPPPSRVWAFSVQQFPLSHPTDQELPEARRADEPATG